MIRSLLAFSFSLSLLYFSAQNGQYTEFTYPDGTISSAGYLLDGLPVGYWKNYHENGQLKSEGNRVNQALDSLWKFYDKSGQLTRSINYYRGKKDGYQEIYSAGQLKERCIYRQDTLQGICVEYEGGKALREVPFQKGVKEGTGYRFNTVGNIVEITHFRKGFVRNTERINRQDKLGRNQGKWYIFFEDRTIEVEGTYLDGEKHGLFKTYDRKGDLLSLEKYEHGLLQTEAAETTVVDIRNEYFPGGKVKSSGSYKDGKKHGIHRDYDQEGNIIASRIYEYGKEIGSGLIGRSGRIEGPWEKRYDHGGIMEKGNYKEGLRDGKWEFFHENGKLSQKGSFRKGKPHGEWIWYHDNGSLHRKEYYRNGREDGDSEEYTAEGKLLSKGKYVDGLKEGAWEYHIGDHHIMGAFVGGEKDGDWLGQYESGKKQFKGSFQRGYAVGKHKFFYASGQLRQVGKYNSGRQTGEWIRYDEEGEIILRSSYESGIERRAEGVRILPRYEELDID